MITLKYISKRYDRFKEPWLIFGAPNKDEYEKWSPVVCGICCLKMIGDPNGSTANVSLYQLTMECKQKGGFKELASGEIQGVFHKPLLDLAKDYGLDGNIDSGLNIEKIIASLQNGRFVILSIDKKKIDEKLEGGHLVLIHTYNSETKTFILHDSEPVLAEKGENVKITFDILKQISNRKGLVIW